MQQGKDSHIFNRKYLERCLRLNVLFGYSDLFWQLFLCVNLVILGDLNQHNIYSSSDRCERQTVSEANPVIY